MGTNYYLMSRNKELMRNNFAVVEPWGVHSEEYAIVDEPYLGYKCHLNKLSCGWRPLFQKHIAFDTFKKLEEFYKNHKDELEIYDEYGTKYTWNEYFDKVYNHSLREPEPVKWVYEPDEVFGDKKPTLHTVRCSEEEADLFIPLNHKEYAETEKCAIRKFRVYRGYSMSVKYYNDPDYLFDWTEGEFS